VQVPCCCWRCNRHLDQHRGECRGLRAACSVCGWKCKIVHWATRRRFLTLSSLLLQQSTQQGFNVHPAQLAALLKALVPFTSGNLPGFEVCGACLSASCSNAGNGSSSLLAMSLRTATLTARAVPGYGNLNGFFTAMPECAGGGAEGESQLLRTKRRGTSADKVRRFEHRLDSLSLGRLQRSHSPLFKHVVHRGRRFQSVCCVSALQAFKSCTQVAHLTFSCAPVNKRETLTLLHGNQALISRAACRYLTLCGWRKVPSLGETAFQQAESLGVTHDTYTFSGMIRMCAPPNSQHERCDLNE
jgi:hypothetical protein